MKNNKMKIKLFFASIAAMLLFAACKTNEMNYRAAYEVAKEKNMGGVDSTTYEKMRRDAMPAKTIVGGDTLRMMRASVRLSNADVNDAAVLKRYNVVVSQFRQIFNAKAMAMRLKNQGYAPMIIENAESVYYVVANSSDTREEAVDIVNRLKIDESIVLREPYPCILEPLHLVK